MKKDKASGVTIFCIFATYIIVFIGLFYTMMIINNNTATYLQENISNSICEANLSSAIIDDTKISFNKQEDGTITALPSFIDIDEAYQLYESCLMYNLNLESSGGMFKPKANTALASKVEYVRVIDYVQIECFYENGKEYLYARDANGYREMVLGEGGYYSIGGFSEERQICEIGTLISPDGVIVSSPSVYSKIIFNVNFGFFSLEKEYECENTISLYLEDI